MTYAPADLLAVRQYLLTSTGLSGDAVGIVGDPAHAATGGYHEGNDDLARVGRLNTDYSKRESARDRAGSNAASAIDIGDFRRGAVSLRSVTLGFVAACQRGDPRTGDVREVIYTPDGSTVRRFDRLGIRSTGDSSHLTHTHISFFRDSEGRRAQADNVLGLLQQLIEGMADMSVWDEKLGEGYAPRPGYGQHMMRTAAGYTWARTDEILVEVRAGFAAAAVRDAAEVARDAAARVALDALAAAITAGGGSVDVMAVKAAMADVVHQAVEPLEAMIAELRAQLAERDRAAAATWADDAPTGG
jgi:hypothetical protein